MRNKELSNMIINLGKALKLDNDLILENQNKIMKALKVKKNKNIDNSKSESETRAICMKIIANGGSL